MSLITLIMQQFIHQNFMKMSEIFVNKCIFINDYNLILLQIYNIMEIDMILYIFTMHRTIIISIRLLVRSQPTCQPD